MKEIDRDIQEAVEIGKANQRTIKLLRDWCANVSIEPFGGVGLVEMQTGLPIGMRRVTCAHARDGGSAAMDVERVAMDFHDRNCVGCSHRVPVRLPNFSEVIARRDERRARAQQEAAAARAAEQTAVAGRAAQRQKLANEGDSARKSLLGRIDELDDDPTPDRAELLLENARAVPDKFDAAVQDSLFALIDAEGPRARAALEVLALVAKGTARLADAAFVMLARREASGMAIDAIGARFRTATVDQIRYALPALCGAATPAFDWTTPKDENAGPLLDAWVVSPATVREFLQRLLSSEHKHSRILGCGCAKIVLEADPSAATEFVRRALQSIGKPDDSRGPEGAASDAASSLVTAALRVRCDEVDALLQAESPGATEEQREVIVQGYAGALRRRGTEVPSAPHVEERCFERIVGVVTASRTSESFGHAIDFLRSWAADYPTLVQRNASALLGGAALILEAARDRYSPILDPRPTPIKVLDARERERDLHAAAEVILELLGSAGSGDPHGVGALLVTTLERAPEGATELRAILTRTLGRIGQSQQGLALILPHLYAGFMARETVIRAAAASAFGEIAKRWSADLPLLLHQTFLLLLQDLFIIVHTAAIDSLDGIRLPAPFADAARRIVRAWVEIYRTDREHTDRLASFIDTFLTLSSEPIAPSERSALNAMLATIPASRAASVVERHARQLDGVPEFGDTVVSVLLHVSGKRDIGDRLLRCVDRLLRADFERRVSDLMAIGTNLHPSPGGELDELLAATARKGAWGVCVSIARTPLDVLEDVPRDRPLLRVVKVRLLAVRVEAALAQGDAESARRFADEWRTAKIAEASEHRDSSPPWTMMEAFAARIEALLGLLRLAKGQVTAEEVGRIETALEAAAASVGPTDAGRAYAAYGRLVGAFTHLARWAHEVRVAGQDADRFLRAGKQTAKDLLARIGEQSNDTWAAGIVSVSKAIGGLTDLEGVGALAAAAAVLPMPLPFPERKMPRARHDVPARSDPPTPCVVFVSFKVDGVQLADPHIITPSELHDLDVAVRVSRWPAGARLVLDALTVEPVPAIGELPRFRFERPDSDAPHELRDGGRLLLNVSQPIAARPLEFVYRAYFEPEQTGLTVVVEGERRLRVRSHDPARNPVTGYSQVDVRLMEIRDELRMHRGLPDSDVDPFLLILASLGQLAGEALQDKLFPEKISESDFQKGVRARLRGNPRIGSRLQEHARVAGGIMDLSYEEITIELKVEHDSLVVPASVLGYSQQAAQYTTGLA